MPQSFTQKVLKIVSKIPRGKTMTYGEVAYEAGSPGAARAVGSIMKYNYDPTIPCHRVIRSDGKLGEYNRGAERKEELLREEGVILLIKWFTNDIAGKFPHISYTTSIGS